MYSQALEIYGEEALIHIGLTARLLNRRHKTRGMAKSLANKTRREREGIMYTRWVEQLIQYANAQYDRTFNPRYRLSGFYRYLKEARDRYAP